jgi:hypothetical protein
MTAEFNQGRGAMRWVLPIYELKPGPARVAAQQGVAGYLGLG